MNKEENNLIKITQLTTQLGLSSRSLRYYEQVGLIQSVRPDLEKYRYYDNETIERLKQIIVLRKMQIPIKDILRIYESKDMRVVVETFVSRINAIDDEISTLADLKRIVSDFLEIMMDNGITTISALPLLYDEMSKQFEMIENNSNSDTYDNLMNVSKRLNQSNTTSIIRLPSMRTITSCLKSNPAETDVDGFWKWVQENNISQGEPGQHERFEFQTDEGDVIMLRIPQDFKNNSNYVESSFHGGLFATTNIYLDEDLGEGFQALIKSFDTNKFYTVDYTHEGKLRHYPMLENLISPDEKRELVMLLIPVKKRVPNPELFDRYEETSSLSADDIKAENPILWEVDVPLDKLTPINYPHYLVLENGEVEYTGWISTRVLNTNVSVKLPFRVDIECKVDERGEQFEYSSDEGSICMYHGTDLNYVFGINMGNRPGEYTNGEAIRFNQPIFRDYYDFPGRGRINRNQYNQLTWIIGEKHFAIIINGEVRFCGMNFPYMAQDLSHEELQPIVIGSDGQGYKYFRSIRISQLMTKQKIKMKPGALALETKRSNNLIPHIRRIITSELGENYWFNGCASYIMECFGEKEYDYQFFAGLTADVFAQYYAFNSFLGEGVSCYEISQGNSSFVEELFEKCGYSSSFVTNQDLKKDKEKYLTAILTSIDKGIPIILYGHEGPPFGVIVGYEEYGQTLLYITGESIEPQRIPLETAFGIHPQENSNIHLIFVNEKNRAGKLSDMYREAIYALPDILTTVKEDYCFGANAFRAWADDIEQGKYDTIKPEEFELWSMYTCYICGLATNGSCCHGFLERAQKLNPDMNYLDEVSSLYKRTADMWRNDNGEDLEALGGGFNVSLEVLQDKDKRKKIASKLREFGDVTDKIVQILNKGMGSAYKN